MLSSQRYFMTRIFLLCGLVLDSVQRFSREAAAADVVVVAGVALAITTGLGMDAHSRKMKTIMTFSFLS